MNLNGQGVTVPAIKVQLPNGESIEADVRVWVAAIINSLPSEMLLKVLGKVGEIKSSLVVVRPFVQAIIPGGIPGRESFGTPGK